MSHQTPDIYRGLQAQGSNCDKMRLPRAADPDKSFILCHAFRSRTGVCQTSFLSLGCRAPLFPIPRDYFLGPDLVVAAAARGWDKEPKAHFIPASAKSARTVKWSGGTARPVAGRKTFILNNNKDSLLVAGFTHEQKTRQASLLH